MSEITPLCQKVDSQNWLLFVTSIALIMNFIFEKLFLCAPKEKVTKRKGVHPAKKHPVSVAGGAHPCAPGCDYPLLIAKEEIFFMKSPIIGHIDFLNVLPLNYGYQHIAQDLKIVYGVPTFLNGELKAERIDLSNISSIEYARQSDELLILPKICVRADDDVTSIVLISRKPIENLRDDKIILTSKSATAQCLLKIILHESYDAAPHYETRSVKVENPVDDDATAALLIGDDALYVYLHSPENFYVYDLGKEWHKLTGRQMVYALWAVRKNFNEPLQATYEKIIRAFEYGIEHKADAINSVLPTKPFSFEELDKYLGGVIKWDLTAEAVDALKLYYRKAAALKLIDKEPALEFIDIK